MGLWGLVRVIGIFRDLQQEAESATPTFAVKTPVLAWLANMTGMNTDYSFISLIFNYIGIINIPIIIRP
jgi:hypothetical protein